MAIILGRSLPDSVSCIFSPILLFIATTGTFARERTLGGHASTHTVPLLFLICSNYRISCEVCHDPKAPLFTVSLYYFVAMRLRSIYGEEYTTMTLSMLPR